MSVSVVIDHAASRDPIWDLEYHGYLEIALRAQRGLKVQVRPRTTATLAALGHWRVPGAHRSLFHVTQDRVWRNPGRVVGFVRYRFDFAAERAVVVVDPHDGRELRYPNALDECDIYFKMNYWRSEAYPAHVRPLLNTNGRLTARAVRTLRALRDTPRTRDLVYWTQIWEPGSPCERNRDIVEHQLRLFEALSRLKCDTDLIAVIPPSLKSVSPAECAHRLESCGVRCRPSWGDIDTARLWHGLARARIVFLRPGNHLCVSWRMQDLLAMGACIVYDAEPYPVWHVPLQPGRHYSHAGCGLLPDYSLPPTSQYWQIGDTIRELLSDPERQSSMRQAASAYFDANCAPDALGAYVIDTVRSLHQSLSDHRMDPALATV